ncbi:lasso peptide biosynthesis B2 protein [Hephaestia sp. GCM10023244]|uniref:lasso peptide biosynthesis B2 protein n=1 Tax=unclassified Hephaestia TaxID=2631281 RepID=UPI0020773D32|nr:lasso peptide biosynthesis B2 protein [Hephaestia sp. MAHUQ-44]MCM8731096.1 lasso peptide biosynthesis B2 protein [Hephaestia sp. MAHUQ-44]
MVYRLRPNLTYCVIVGRNIFLDIANGRYFALPTKLDEIFVRVQTITCVDEASSAEINHLCTANLLVGEGEAVEIAGPTLVTPASTDLLSSVTGNKPGIFLIAWALVEQLFASLLLHLLPFSLVARLFRHQGRGGGNALIDPVFASLLAQAFRTAGILLKAEGKCLPRTMAFARACRRRGYDVNLVIGVSINPFTAHCWAQAGDVVLNDTIDRTSNFQPIFIT